MKHYKSWSGLNKQLSDCLCDELKSRISYFLTRYHKVHNAYGRAAIRFDGKELVDFTWMDAYQQEWDADAIFDATGIYDPDSKELKEKWDADCTYGEMDFLNAVTLFLHLPIEQSLTSANAIVRILAIMDRRVGKRTLCQIRRAGEYKKYPLWVRQFYELRFAAEEGIDVCRPLPRETTERPLP